MNWLFDTEDFTRRCDCGIWPTWLMLTNISSNAIIALSYWMIGICLFYYYKMRSGYSGKKNWMILLFGLFIFSCGITHMLDALLFKWPVYRLLTLFDFITAVVSAGTCALLPMTIKYAMGLKTPEELQQINDKLEILILEKIESEKRIQTNNHELANEVHRLQAIVATQGWVAEKQMDLNGMKNIIKELRKEYVHLS